MKPQTKTAFTLVELLVVIAIIALIAAILFPVFARARENARRTSCQSNLKQLGLGMLQYTQDFDERFPCGILFNSNYHEGQGWGGEIYPYVKSPQVFTCPSDTYTNKATTGVVVSYAYNTNFANVLAPVRVPASLSQVTSPPLSVLLFEAGPAVADVASLSLDAPTNTYGDWGPWQGLFASSTTGGDGYTYVEGGNIYAGPGKNATGPMGGRTSPADVPASDPNNFYKNMKTGRHFDGANFLLADGHVKWLKGSAVSSGPNPCGYLFGTFGPCMATLPQDVQYPSLQSFNHSAGTQAMSSFAATFSVF